MGIHPLKVKFNNNQRVRRTYDQEQEIINSFKTISSHTFTEEVSNAKPDNLKVNEGSSMLD